MACTNFLANRHFGIVFYTSFNSKVAFHFLYVLFNLFYLLMEEEIEDVCVYICLLSVLLVLTMPIKHFMWVTVFMCVQSYERHDWQRRTVSRASYSGFVLHYRCKNFLLKKSFHFKIVSLVHKSTCPYKSSTLHPHKESSMAS